MDYQVLSSELTNDPLGRGYSSMDDSAAADDLNTDYREVNYKILIDDVNYAIREVGKWSDFREEADLQTEPNVYNNPKMREFMDIFTTFTSLPQIDMESEYVVNLIDDMVGEGSMGSGAAAALKTLGIQIVSRGVELELGTVKASDVKYARTL